MPSKQGGKKWILHRKRYPKDKACKKCEKVFSPGAFNQKFCSSPCRNGFYDGLKGRGIETICPTTVGAVAELTVAIDLLRAGWAVFRALSPACFCDLVAIKDGITRKIEVRTGYRNGNGDVRHPLGLRGDASEYAIFIRVTGEIVYIPVPME